jgi:predicted RNase H-like HicB family nuclease
VEYSVIIGWDEECRSYCAYAPALPGCRSCGDTREEVLDNIRDAMELCLQVYREKGWPIPREPRSIEVATVQIA